jgi:predicted flap endonuclease-1-like 5' DNA nuclease
MPAIDTNMLILIAAGIAVVALLLWLLLRGRSRADVASPAQPEMPRAPLEPAKPVIDVATPVSFAPPPPVQPAPAPATSDGDRPAIAAAVGSPDDLRQIKGIGPKLATLLASLGITRFDQIAGWTAADIAEVDRFLGSFAGRIERDNWVEQADYLARGDREGFAARFGALGG